METRANGTRRCQTPQAGSRAAQSRPRRRARCDAESLADRTRTRSKLPSPQTAVRMPSMTARTVAPPASRAAHTQSNPRSAGSRACGPSPVPGWWLGQTDNGRTQRTFPQRQLQRARPKRLLHDLTGPMRQRQHPPRQAQHYEVGECSPRCLSCKDPGSDFIPRICASVPTPALVSGSPILTN